LGGFREGHEGKIAARSSLLPSSWGRYSDLDARRRTWLAVGIAEYPTNFVSQPRVFRRSDSSRRDLCPPRRAGRRTRTLGNGGLPWWATLKKFRMRILDKLDYEVLPGEEEYQGVPVAFLEPIDHIQIWFLILFPHQPSRRMNGRRTGSPPSPDIEVIKDPGKASNSAAFGG